MNIFITLDYELFFYNKSGSVENSIIKPTQELLDILNPYNLKATFFVDVGYPYMLKKYKDQYPELQKDWDKLTTQIRTMSNNGHAIQLHIHPHWEDTIYNGKKWVFDTDRYKLSDFSEEEVMTMVTNYKHLLEELSGKPVTTFRAGGWSIQPFKNIGKALEKNKIFKDTTVYPKGYYLSEDQYLDFRKSPTNKTKWNFSKDPAIEDVNGQFTEIPISSMKVSPLFFWRLAFTKVFKQKKFQPYGDGDLKLNHYQISKLLLKPSYTVISIDGLKASLLNQGLKQYKGLKEKETNFVIIGHPKSFSKYSLGQLKKFIKKQYKNHDFIAMK